MPTFLEFSAMSDAEVEKTLKDNKIGLTVDEARKVEEILGRAPTLTEAVIWGIQGSEHCSYRSTRPHLAKFSTDAPNVILGPKEDAGIVEIARDGKKRWGLVMSHESHNHPSQIVPYEGAATGIGGNLRDVACMGAKVVATLDSLRFGRIQNNEARVIANEVVRGIAGYGNPVGIPNAGGDILFDESFDDNCLVNVVTLGVVREDEIIHSYAPAEAADVGYDIILVGKPTDNSGMGGASFASVELDEGDKEANKGAVQEPNPFLKRHLLASTYDLFKKLKDEGNLGRVGFKDMGAGGNTCSTVEQVVDRGFGAEIAIDKIHVAIEGLHPSVIAASETQERFAWICHPDLTQMILDHYNVKWDLGSVAKNAKASLVGKVTKGGQFVMTYNGEKVIDAPATLICQGLQYKRESKERKYDVEEPEINAKTIDLNKLFVQVLGSENIASRRHIYNKYDKNVQGNSIIESGEADAGVIAPLLEKEGVPEEIQKTGVAISVDGNSRYSKISPYWQAVNATVEAMRNVAAVGATPAALTDCLNYNNPENPEFMWEFIEGVRGIIAAQKAIELKDHPGSPTPIISGNVSLYNSIDATADIACSGVIKNYEKAITMQLKSEGNKLFLIGERKNELGGSEFYLQLGHVGANVPQPDLKQAKNEIFSVIDAIDAELVESCHDISEGGIAITLAEMTMPHPRIGGGKLSVLVDLSDVGKAKDYQKAFSETGGFVCEVKQENADDFKNICASQSVHPIEIGHVTASDDFVIKDQGDTIISQPLNAMQNVWLTSLQGKLK